MKLLILLLTLLLTGCTADHAMDVPAAEESVSPPEALYLYDAAPRYLAIDQNGRVVLEVTDGQMSLVYDDTGSAIAICVSRSEGVVTDEYGWKQPERTWCDIYNTDGSARYSLPVDHVNLFDGLILGYNSNESRTQLYRYEDGGLLYDNVFVHYDLGDYHYVNQENWESPGFFLDKTGNLTAALPEGFTHGSSVLNQYLVVSQNGSCGVMDPQGTLLLPCEYEEIRTGHLGCVYAKKDGSWSAIEVESGKILFQWPYEIRMLLPDSVIASADHESQAFYLMDKNGMALMEHRLGWISEYDEDTDGIPELLTTSINDYTTFLCFRPDGTQVFSQSTENGSVFLLSPRYALSHSYLWEDDGYAVNDWQLFDLDTGEWTTLSQGGDAYASPFYSMNGQAQDCFYISKSNEVGWSRSTVYDLQGNVLLDGLQDIYYRGNGVLQCQKGFTSGLMRLDGTWLYEESSFSALEDH